MLQQASNDLRLHLPESALSWKCASVVRQSTRRTVATFTHPSITDIHITLYMLSAGQTAQGFLNATRNDVNITLRDSHASTRTH